MTFPYAWLRILEALAKRDRGVPVEHLRDELQRVGIVMDDAGLEAAVDRLREEGLVEVLVLAGGDVQGIAITPRGARKVRGIVRF